MLLILNGLSAQIKKRSDCTKETCKICSLDLYTHQKQWVSSEIVVSFRFSFLFILLFPLKFTVIVLARRPCTYTYHSCRHCPIIVYLCVTCRLTCHAFLKLSKKLALEINYRLFLSFCIKCRQYHESSRYLCTWISER